MSTKEKNMDARIAFGNSLSEKRRESGFSQEELGLKIGKSSNPLSSSRSHSLRPSIKMLLKLF